MEKDKIKELFQKHHSTCYDAMEARHVKVLLPGDFTQAINQAEKEMKLEWYKGLEKKLDSITDGTKNYVVDNVCDYLNEIQNKIKELENENRN